MTEEKKEHKPTHWGIKTLLSTAGSTLLLFFAHTLWDSMGANEKAVNDLNSRIKSLEDDKAKWELLTDLNNRMILLERSSSVHNNDVEWLKRAYGVPVVLRETSKPLPTMPPNPNPPPPPREQSSSGNDSTSPPKLIPPDELRKIYEQKAGVPKK